MSKFNTGELVVFSTGPHAGRKGIVTNPWWQISQSDWPEVEVQFTDGGFGYGKDEDIELVEDRYEYATQKFYGKTPRTIHEDEWTTEEVARGRFNATSSPGVDPTWGAYTVRLVKRRKAGRIEDV